MKDYYRFRAFLRALRCAQRIVCPAKPDLLKNGLARVYDAHPRMLPRNRFRARAMKPIPTRTIRSLRRFRKSSAARNLKIASVKLPLSYVLSPISRQKHPARPGSAGAERDRQSQRHIGHGAHRVTEDQRTLSQARARQKSPSATARWKRAPGEENAFTALLKAQGEVSAGGAGG